MCYTNNLAGPKAYNIIHVNRDQILPYGLGSRRQRFQIRLEFFPGKHALISCLQRITWFIGGCWRIHVAVSVIELMKLYCMCSGCVGQHRTFGLAVQSGFKNLVLSKWILGNWFLVSCRGFHWRSWIYFGWSVGKFGFNGTQSCMGVPSNTHHSLTSGLWIIWESLMKRRSI